MSGKYQFRKLLHIDKLVGMINPGKIKPFLLIYTPKIRQFNCVKSISLIMKRIAE